MGDYNSGSDAAYMKPKFVPDDALHGPDMSGGPQTPEDHYAEFGEGGRITHPKSYLTVGRK